MRSSKGIILIITIGLTILYFNGPGAGKYSNLFGGSMVASAQEDASGEPGVTTMYLHGQFNPENYLEDGLPTIIEISWDRCPNCTQLNKRHLPRFLPLRPDVAVKILRLPDQWNPEEIERDHGVLVTGTPFIIVYGPDGKLLASDEDSGNDGHEFLYDWMNYEIKNAGNKG